MKFLTLLTILALAFLALTAVTAQDDQCMEQCEQEGEQCQSGCPGQCSGSSDPSCAFSCVTACTNEVASCAQGCQDAVMKKVHPVKKIHHIKHAVKKHAPKSVAVTLPSLTEEHYQTEFTSFVKKHNKKYTSDEFFPRYSIFKANYNKIRQHNAEHDAGKHTYTMGINEFADMTFEEFHSKMTGYKRVRRDHIRSKNAKKMLKSVQGSGAIDWRTKNAVTPPKNQLKCGSCWSFSTTGAVEGAHAIATGTLISLSEQQLIDCSAPQGNNGCNGGMMDQAFEYIIQNNGITTEAAYPYQAKVNPTCNTNVPLVATISSYNDVPQDDEDSLLQYLQNGPVSIAIEADQHCFQFYKSGVLTNPACGQNLDHGVLLVGAGTDAATGTDFWVIKNSWGPTWGEGGFIRIQRGTNECGVASEPSQPVV